MASVQSVDRALDLLVAVAQQPAGLTDLARRTDLPVSTTSRLLATLEARRAVSRSMSGEYVAGPLLSNLDSQTLSQLDLEAVARPHAVALAHLTGEAVAMTVPSGDDSLTVLQVDTPKPVRAQDWTGERWPLTAGGSGLVMLATWPAKRVDAVLSSPLRSCTSATCTDEAEIRRRLSSVARRNVGWSCDEYVQDLTSVASAVLGPDGRAVASVLIYGPSFRFPARGSKRVLEGHVLALAEQIATDAFIGRRCG